MKERFLKLHRRVTYRASPSLTKMTRSKKASHRNEVCRNVRERVGTLVFIEFIQSAGNRYEREGCTVAKEPRHGMCWPSHQPRLRSVVGFLRPELLVSLLRPRTEVARNASPPRAASS